MDEILLMLNPKYLIVNKFRHFLRLCDFLKLEFWLLNLTKLKSIVVSKRYSQRRWDILFSKLFAFVHRFSKFKEGLRVNISMNKIGDEY